MALPKPISTLLRTVVSYECECCQHRCCRDVSGAPRCYDCTYKLHQPCRQLALCQRCFDSCKVGKCVINVKPSPSSWITLLQNDVLTALERIILFAKLSSRKTNNVLETVLTRVKNNIYLLKNVAYLTELVYLFLISSSPESKICLKLLDNGARFFTHSKPDEPYSLLHTAQTITIWDSRLVVERLLAMGATILP